MRARELAARASYSRLEFVERSIIEGVYIDVGITDGDPNTEGAGSGEPDPPACLSLTLCASGLLHLPPFLYFLMIWGQLDVFLLGVEKMESEC